MDEYFSGAITGPVYFLPKLVKQRSESIGVVDYGIHVKECEQIVDEMRVDLMQWFKAHDIHDNQVGSRVHRVARVCRMFQEALRECIRVRVALSDDTVFNNPQPMSNYILATGRRRDAYGNPIYKLTVNWPGVGHHDHKRLIIELRTRLETTNLAGKIKRWVRDKFPRLVNPLNAKLDTVFNTKVKVWFDPCHFYEFSLYKTHLHKVVIRPTNVNHERERLEYEHRVFFFRYGPGGHE